MHWASSTPSPNPQGNPLAISFLVESLNFMQILCKHLTTKFILENILIVLCIDPHYKLAMFYSFIRGLVLIILYAKYLLNTFYLLCVQCHCLSKGFADFLPAILQQPPTGLSACYISSPVPSLHHRLSYFSTIQICSCQPLAQNSKIAS